MTPQQFRTRLPEFLPIEDEQIQRALDDADNAVSDSYGKHREHVVALTAAHNLALSPMGRDAKLSSGDGKSVYLVRLREYKISNAYSPSRVR